MIICCRSLAALCLNLAFGLVAAKAAEEQGNIIGHGSLKYRVHADWSKADPSKAPIINAHAMAESSKGELYLVTDHPANDFLVYAADGSLLRTISANLGGGHGLEIFTHQGQEYLLHVDCGWHFAAEGWNPKAGEGCITLLDLQGKVLRRFPTPTQAGLKTGKFMPCDVAITPQATVLVADGYASNRIYEYNLEGKILRHWGGPSKDAANLSNAHGISIDMEDPRGPTLWIPSRNENQLKAFSLEGKHLETLDLPGAYAGQLVARGNLLYTAVCWSKDKAGKRLPESGFVLVLDRKTKKVLSAPGGTEPTYAEGKLQPLSQAQRIFKHCHDLLVDRQGNIFVGEWNAQRRYPTKLERLR